MKLLKILLACLVIVIAGCECGDESLNKTCPTSEQLGEPCFVFDDGSWRVINPKIVSWNVSENSQCRVGHTACDPDSIDKEVTCEGFRWSEEEVCDNVDNDCDFKVDEGEDNEHPLAYEYGEDGNDCNLLGVCAEADKVCLNGEFQCVPRDGPDDELCDGKDNDCDGVVDDIEPRECWGGRSDAIFDETTQCQKGLRYCESGSWSPCRDQILPSAEICDEIDNDCDGITDGDYIDEGDACGPSTSVGQCSYGQATCNGGETICVNPVFPQNESCDNVDNDCDGTVDEELFQPCSTICGAGIEFCSAGQWVGCTAQQPGEEICDGFDNDCDGDIDEDCPCLHGDVQTCMQDIVDANGVLLDPQCGVGIHVCEFGEWGPCQFYDTFPEECNNWDDDCDGNIDNYTEPCGSDEHAGVGECKLGEATCIEGEWSDCEGAVDPVEEICNQKDDDCDGEVDEELDPHEKVDMCFLVDISGSMCPYYEALAGGIANYVADFQGTDHRFCLITYPDSATGDPLIVTLPPLVEVGAFSAALQVLACDGGGVEPTYDVLDDVTDPTDPLGIGWRPDAHPYVVVITDEPAQTLENTTEADIASNTTNCQIGDCESGDQIEVFIITGDNYTYQYDTIVYGETEDRIIEINPADENRYTEILRGIFEEVCIY